LHNRLGEGLQTRTCDRIVDSVVAGFAKTVLVQAAGFGAVVDEVDEAPDGRGGLGVMQIEKFIDEALPAARRVPQQSADHVVAQI